ncbi:hypothetical protein JZ751_010807 [Albula glossodonta]|uniref:Uncharacterized protein n=1 Tax=Albula glossodonta TaxID=121402 RepID=A0A8T2N4Y0_9TELE|nr:hypothetical protein JZ751_010807 [Albula glossodonta]
MIRSLFEKQHSGPKLRSSYIIIPSSSSLSIEEEEGGLGSPLLPNDFHSTDTLLERSSSNDTPKQMDSLLVRVISTHALLKTPFQ